jgi:hypothetical protein
LNTVGLKLDVDLLLAACASRSMGSCLEFERRPRVERSFAGLEQARFGPIEKPEQ